MVPTLPYTYTESAVPASFFHLRSGLLFVAAMDVEFRTLLRIVVFSLFLAWFVNYIYAARRRRQVSCIDELLTLLCM